MIYTPFTNGESPAQDAINARLQSLDNALLSISTAPGSITFDSSSTARPGWLVCDGSAVSRTTYAALFAVIGTAYGVGDGITTFNLPDMRGRTAIGAGQGVGLTNRVLGTMLGEENHQLTITEMPSHTHTQFRYLGGGAAVGTAGVSQPYFNGGAALQTSDTGNDQPHNNMQPSLVVNWIIKT